MEQATEKQISYAARLGLDVSGLTKDAARTAIDKALGGHKQEFTKTLPYPQVETAEKSPFIAYPKTNKEFGVWKKEKDVTNMYVSYAKDLCIAVMEARVKRGDKELEIDKIMEACLICIDNAKKHFEK